MDELEITQEEASERLAQPAGTFTENETHIKVAEGSEVTSGQQTKANSGATSKGNQNANEQSLDFGQLGTSYFEKMGLPKDFKPEEGKDPVEAIGFHMQKKFEESLPPFTRMVLQNERVQGFNEDEFISQFAKHPASALKGEALQKEYLFEKYGRFDQEKNPDGLTESDVTDHLSKLNRIQKIELEKEASQHFGSTSSKKMEEYLAARQKQADEQFTAHVTKMQDISKAILEDKDVKGIKSVLGVEVSAEDIAEFNKVFGGIITPNEETRLAPLMEWIYGMDNVELYKLAFFLHKKEPFFKQLVDDRVRDSSLGLKKKMGLSPRKANEGHQQGPQEIDPYLLTIPEQKR